MRWVLQPATIGGDVRVPGDKSISHRGLILGALAGGESRISGLSTGEDVLSTAACLRNLGAAIDLDGETATVRGPHRLSAPEGRLDAGNSGTTMRLLAGVLAAQPFRTTLVGDESLSRRPMRRVIDPLEMMGARIESRDGCAPLVIHGGDLHAIQYDSPLSSAQVKSAILLAGIFAQGRTSVREPVRSRDHTERMLESCNVQVSRENGAVTVVGGSRPSPFTLQVPGDPSSAAFLQAAAALTGGCVTVRDVSANETRTGFLRVLEQMGVRVAMSNPRTWMGEPVADTTVSGAPSRPIHVTEPDIPALIDEIPVIALLLTQVPGTSVIRGAAELRLKETDRIDTVARSLKAMGAEVEEHPDGMTIHGPTPLRGAEVESYGDHRLGMMLAVAGACAEGETVLTGAEAAAVSFPAFPDTYRQVGGRLDVS